MLNQQQFDVYIPCKSAMKRVGSQSVPVQQSALLTHKDDFNS